MGTVVLWWCLKHFSYGSLMQVYCKLNPFYTRRWSLVFPCDTALCTNTLHRSPPSCVSELLVSQAGVPLSHLSSLEKCPKTLPCCTRPQHPRTSHFCTCAMMRQQEWVALLKSGEHHTVSWFYIWFWSQFRMMKQDTSAQRHQSRLTLPFCTSRWKKLGRLPVSGKAHLYHRLNCGPYHLHHQPALLGSPLSRIGGWWSRHGLMGFSPARPGNGDTAWWSLAGRSRNILRCFSHSCTAVA